MNSLSSVSIKYAVRLPNGIFEYVDDTDKGRDLAKAYYNKMGIKAELIEIKTEISERVISTFGYMP